ncbi:uncharacterized protein [Mycetomoellerius zeteki]|uniref:uncharacterized protein n=1 Tax=Mycetomoellerius zeteki TaxID=64791 RepID=UPI00084E5BD9|nr:PREDICTED: uncharacterized protein LOC108728857 [Trachymyrmex zeteki]
MVFSGERYYNIYRIMLTAIGLWPYQTSIVMQVQSVFFLGLLNAVTISNDISEITMCIGIVLAHFLFILVPNFIGQSLTDHSAEIFNAAYNTLWYLAPLSIQKLLLFLMQNSLKTHTLIIGHLYVTSLEGFSTVINTL